MSLLSSMSAPRRPPPHAREDEPDEATVRRAQAGDRAAQAALIERYQQPVFALLWRIAGPERAVVEDLAQETFLRMLGALPRFEPSGKARLVTWILTIATRLAINHLRATGGARGGARERGGPIPPPGGVP